MAYITTSNSKKIIRNLNEVKFEEISEKLYKWDIYFFSKRETSLLKAFRELLRNPEKFVVEYYEPIVVVDSYRYLQAENQPAYHINSNCKRLKSNFINIEIPLPIRDKGKDEVYKFRDWYKNTEFKNDDITDYIFKLQLKFPYVGEINPNSIDYSNSGIIEKKNYSLVELENEIDLILKKSTEYFKDNPHLRDIIKRYQKWTFLGYVYGQLNNNETTLSDEELKEFLRNYDTTFKKPVKYLLEEYYRIKFNPEMTFDGTILKKLGFRTCGNCLEDNLHYDYSPMTEENSEIDENEI